MSKRAEKVLFLNTISGMDLKSTGALSQNEELSRRGYFIIDGIIIIIVSG